MTDLEKEVLGLKTELSVVIQYLSTVKAMDGQPILGPNHWDGFQEDLKKALKKAGL